MNIEQNEELKAIVKSLKHKICKKVAASCFKEDKRYHSGRLIATALELAAAQEPIQMVEVKRKDGWLGKSRITYFFLGTSETVRCQLLTAYADKKKVKLAKKHLVNEIEQEVAERIQDCPER